MSSKKYLIINLLSISFFLTMVSFCQTDKPLYPEIEKPFIKYFSPKEYHASYQNWCLIQDKRGIMYFGNNNGILEYDGNLWRLIKSPNNSVVRSLCMDSKGRIYVAASSDFGYLAPDSIGQLRFVSLLKYLGNKYKRFGDVWDVAVTLNGVYYKTQDKIFKWNGNKIKVFESVYAHRLYKINNSLFVRNNGAGLFEISGDSLMLVPDGKKFSSIGIYDMLPFKDKILVTTNANGLFLYDGYNFSKFKTEADSFLVKNRLYNTCELSDGRIAFATQRGGVAIIDRRGHLSKIINSQNGLQSDVVYDVYQDKQGGLWLATTEGISRVEILSPFTEFDKKSIGNDFISSIYRFHDKIYAANSFGIFYYDKLSSSFKPVTGINSGGENFVSENGSLLASSVSGIYKIGKDNNAHMLFDFDAPSLYKSDIDTNIIYITYRIGLAVLQFNAGRWQIIKRIPGIKSEIDNLVEDSDGSLWIETEYEGIIHFSIMQGKRFSSKDTGKIIMEYYNNNNGLPGKQCNILSFGGKVHFATDVGLFRFEPGSNKFIYDSCLGESFIDSAYSILFCEKNYNSDLWILANSHQRNELGKAVKQKDGRYQWQPDPVFRRLDLNSVFTIYSDLSPEFDNEHLWISTDEGVFRYNPEIKRNYNKEFPTYIRSVKINQDSLIFAGTEENSLKKNRTFPFEYNDITFQFSTVNYDKSEANLYQYYLEGNDDVWSQWTTETVKEYTNVSNGNYKFHVRSKNIYGIIGKEDSFDFIVLSPWYFSGWAYVLYSIIFLGLLFLLRHFELKRLNKKHAVELDLVAFEKLKELDQLKSQFFANISHEFRTPLTLILGQIESVLSSKIDVKEKGKLHVANRNARRLLTLINQLLDLSKIESGSMELKAEQHNIVSFLKSLFWSFESIAESKKITLKFETEFENIPVIFDPDKMEKIFYNLVSNAFKFTPAGGEIKVCLNILNNSMVELHIKDTGKGISKEQFIHIFDRFYQGDSSNTREYEGTGIGLSLTKELIELHKGTISVSTEVGKGTDFIVNLPLGDMSLDKEKLVYKNKFSFIEINNQFKTDRFSENPQPAAGIQLPETGNKEIILIVEDNPDVRAYMLELTKQDYKVIEACNGVEGISKAQEAIPDIIITDVMMPKMDGYKFSKEIRNDEKTSHIPIIMLTAKAGLDDKIEGLETGIDAYLTKPFSAKELRVRIKNLIVQRKELRRKFSQATIIKPSEVSIITADQQFLQKAIKIIESHFDDEQFSVEKLAEEMNMSVSQLNRKLNALIDQPAGQVIRSLRLQKAADLLKQNAGSIAEICYKVGFNDQAYFTRAFKKQFGYTPSDFKKT